MPSLLPRFNGCVLLVEDNSVNALVARTTVEELDVTVEAASDGRPTWRAEEAPAGIRPHADLAAILLHYLKLG